jgi:pimeloyl-ACP methyl ester carboxylesterase
VLVFDNIGAGLSSKPDRPYTIAQMADHAAAVMDAADDKGAYVVGLSMGGMIAQELALRHPARVCALVLGCTHCGGSTRVPPDPKVIQRFADNQGLSPEEIVDKNLNLLVTPAFLQSGSELLERYRERQLKAPFQPDYALQRQLEAIGDFDTCERLADIKAPTLILTAEHDLLVPPENGGILASRIPRAVHWWSSNLPGVCRTFSPQRLEILPGPWVIGYRSWVMGCILPITYHPSPTT